jgi:hypothetical protein
MPLKTVLESLDGVDDALKSFYAETEGKFVLQVEGVDDHPEVANLKNAYERTKRDKETERTKAQALAARIAELEKGAPDTAATQAKIADLQAKLDAEIAKTGELSTKLTGVTRDRTLAEALTASGVTEPAFLKASQAMLSGMVKMGEDGTAFVETPMGPKLVSAFVKDWAASEGKAFVTPAQGGGAKGQEQGARPGTIKRADFDQMSPAAKADAMKAGATLVD